MRCRRPEPTMTYVVDAGRHSIMDVVDWVYDRNELGKAYNWISDDLNCKGFARDVFGQFAESQTFDFVRLDFLLGRITDELLNGMN
jgi:hypothetical protein